jgi:hypothetical protein
MEVNGVWGWGMQENMEHTVVPDVALQDIGFQ